MSELKNYTFQQSYRTELRRTLSLTLYIYTLRQKHKRAGQ